MLPSIEQVEALVIGSGFGGSIAALRLAEAGVKTIVLEKGRRWPFTPQQNTFCTYREPDGRAAWLSDETVVFDPKPIDRYTGLLERHIEDGITVWTSCGVGGGSLVYNTVLLQPTKKNFYKVFPKEVDYKEMATVWYPKVKEAIGTEKIPDDILESEFYRSSRVFVEQSVDLETHRLDLGSCFDSIRDEMSGKLQPSAISGEIWYGINSGAKKSLDKNYLKLAEESGLVEVRPLHCVTEVSEAPSGCFSVKCNELNEKGEILATRELVCNYLFLGAGSIGTSHILTRARATGTLPRLNSEVGKHWGNNGDTFATRAVGTRTNPGQGGPASFAIHHYDNPLGPQTLIVYPEWDAPEGTLTTLGMGIPKTLGKFTYDLETDVVSLHWPAEAAGNKRVVEGVNVTYRLLDEGLKSHDENGQAKAKAHKGFHHCSTNTTTFPGPEGETQASSGVTAHPLGGAVMDEACDLFGRVKGYEGLYVTDGAFIPGSAAATNPALTIAAFAERSMATIIAEDIIKSRTKTKETTHV